MKKEEFHKLYELLEKYEEHLKYAEKDNEQIRLASVQHDVLRTIIRIEKNEN